MKFYPHSCFALLLVIALGVVVAAQTQSDETASDATKTGTISGRVVDYAGQPLADAVVSIRGYGAATGRTTTTDSGGNFRVTGLDSVAYLISALFPGYVAAP